VNQFEICWTLLKATLPTPATFTVSPVEPAPMLTLSTVPLTKVVAAVPPEGAPAYCALKV
jgi:hypothetical protein